MGAFDHFFDHFGVEWQTKSFTRPNLDRYRVTDKGYLEKGDPLDLPSRYFDDSIELMAHVQRVLKDGPRWAWTKSDFSGVILASALSSDGKMREAKFDFQDGVLVGVDAP